MDWNDQKYCEIWRHEWEVIQNRYLEANDRPERVDLRSYARQGLDIVPTVHEGAAVRQMEKRGIQTNIGNLNREIRAANSLMKSIRQLIQNLKGWITELGEKRKELLAQKAAEEATLLPNLLMKYMEIRKEERKDWTRAGQNRGTSQDLKAVSEALSYLRQKGLSTVEDLEAFLESSGKSAADYLEETYGLTNEKKIDNAIGIVANENKYHPIRDYLSSLVWDGTERIRFCLRHFLGADADDYTYEALKLFLLGAISRAFQPGCKFEIMLCLVGGQGAGKSTFFRLLAVRDEWFSDDLRKLDDDNVYRKLQGHWIIEMSEMMATANAKSIEEIKSFLSRQKEVYKIPYAARSFRIKRS